jgi:endoglucanase
MVIPAVISALSFGAPTTSGSWRTELASTWDAYRTTYISHDGRAIDYKNGAITSSEGQSYAMLRALWMDDRETFDRVWRWTNQNLQGGNPEGLPAWKWGKAEDGQWTVLDAEPAADADQLLAYSLLGAGERWKIPAYSRAAHALINEVWNNEVGEVAGRLVLLPGLWAKDKRETQLNPSYFLPFAWRAFAKADAAHDWGRLIDDGYVLLADCRGSSGLPKDWCHLDSATGLMVPPANPAHDSFGFEAFRVAWTLAAEVSWHRERRAKALLGPYISLLSRPANPVRIPGVIGADGAAQVDWAYPGMLGALLPAWAIRRPAAAKRMWREELAPLRAQHGWGDPDDYYGQNWIWFGLALWQGKERPV